MIVPAMPGDVLADASRRQVRASEVHAWAFALEGPGDALERCAALLSEEERGRAARFHFPVHRDRYVLAHGLMRHVLARYAGVDPRALGFVEAPEGKPRLENVPGLSFNLSHSHERALLAVGDGRELGCDVEQERDEVDMLGIAGSYFFRSELESIRSAGGAQATRERFFRHWVAKESVLKAEGCGLGFPLDKFEVAFDASGEGATVTSFDATRMKNDWTVRMLSLGPGWPAAVASKGRSWSLRLIPDS